VRMTATALVAKMKGLIKEEQPQATAQMLLNPRSSSSRRRFHSAGH
jgi:hypothetical protein